MTDQTVPIPLDLLKRLFDNTTLTRDVFAGDSVEVRPSAIGALIDIKALIPTPHKVGDVLTAVQVYDLPVRSTFVDSDDDVYVVTAPRQIFRVTNVYGPGFQTTDEMEEADAPYSDFNELRVTFIPKPRD